MLRRIGKPSIPGLVYYATLIISFFVGLLIGGSSNSTVMAISGAIFALTIFATVGRSIYATGRTACLESSSRRPAHAPRIRRASARTEQALRFQLTHCSSVRDLSEIKVRTPRTIAEGFRWIGVTLACVVLACVVATVVLLLTGVWGGE
jgi:hypothetical protein